MPTLLILILALLVATCVIAYWSDNLGKKLGKKRISLFGLRPRQTATFISMGSSVGIMLLTLGVLLGSSASLRNALTRYDQTKKENSTLLATNKKLRDDSGKLQAQSNQWRQQADRARRDAADAGAQTATARAQLTRVRGELATARNSARQAQAQAATAQRQYRTAQAGLRTAQLSLQTAQKELQSKEQQLKNVNLRLYKVQGEIDKKQKELNQSRKLLAASQRAVSATRRAFTATQRVVTFTAGLLKESQKQLDQLEEERKSLVAERTSLETDVRYLRGEINDVRAEIIEVRRVKENLSAGRVEFLDRQVFAAQTVQAHVSPAEARAMVRSLLVQGEAYLRKSDRDMLLVRTLPMGNVSAELTEEQLITLLVDSLTSSRVPVSVRLQAAGNHAVDENPIRVRFFTVDVNTLLPQGAVIAHTVIDSENMESGNSDAQIFGKLLDLLNAGEALLRNKPYEANPLLTEENRFNFWPKGTNERIFEALRQIQASDKAVEVRLVAATTLVTTGPMQIRFEVRELEN